MYEMIKTIPACMWNVTWEIEKEGVSKRERKWWQSSGREKEQNPKEKKSQRDRATVTIVFYPFLDHVTKNQLWGIQTDQSSDYSFLYCTKGVTISRYPMYTYLGRQPLITISTSCSFRKVRKIGLEQESKYLCSFSTLQVQRITNYKQKSDCLRKVAHGC